MTYFYSDLLDLSLFQICFGKFAAMHCIFLYMRIQIWKLIFHISSFPRKEKKKTLFCCELGNNTHFSTALKNLEHAWPTLQTQIPFSTHRWRQSDLAPGMSWTIPPTTHSTQHHFMTVRQKKQVSNVYTHYNLIVSQTIFRSSWFTIGLRRCSTLMQYAAHYVLSPTQQPAINKQGHCIKCIFL